MKKLLLTSVLALAATAFSLHASDPATTPWHLTTVAWIKANENDIDRDNAKVAVVGTITEKHSSHIYFFKDEDGGTIQLDSDIDLPVGQKIVVRGRIDQAFLHIGPLEINVDSWRHIGKLGQIIDK